MGRVGDREGRRAAAVAVTGAVLLVVASSCSRASREAVADGGGLARAIAEVEAGRKSTPLVSQPVEGGEVTVTFLVESPGGRVPRIVSDVTGWGERVADGSFDMGAGAMARVGRSDWYRLETRVASAARVEYLTVPGEGDYRVDPHNPRRSEFHASGPVSEFVAPGYVPPREFTDAPSTPAGALAESAIDSRALGGFRRVVVYTPPGYPRAGSYPVAVFHSGWSAAREGQAPRVLDWLIAHGEIEPIVAVFLESHRPGDPDFRAGEPMRTFLVDEVPAWVASRYRVGGRAGERALLAISFGARDALDAALAPERAYGRLGLLIPGRRLTPADIEAAAARRGRRLRVAILAGLYDGANLATARGVREALSAAGHDVAYLEVAEGHNPSTWRNHLGDVLVSLLGKR
ncbi:MAG: alpha/beta hydrolase [Acidobacteriota bacterium]